MAIVAGQDGSPDVSPSARCNRQTILAWVMPALAIVTALAIQLPRYVQHDVAYLTWVAGQVSDGAAFGRDILELNPPLNFLIYYPAAVLGKLMALDLAIKLWVCAIAALSLALVSAALPKDRRIPVLTALGVYFALAFPWDFGQREQIAMLLCAPYAAGTIARRRWAIVSGVAAGIGFAIKPHFLIALALIFLARRKIRAEEWAIAATGAVYAAALLLVFPAYLTDMVPIARATYWSVAAQENYIARIAILGALLTPALALLAVRPNATAMGFGAAALGFFLAALLQGKYFQYHFIPAWGFLVLLLAAREGDGSRLARMTSLALLTLSTGVLLLWSLNWLGSGTRYGSIPKLLHEIDRSDSFLVMTVHPFPAFPTAIYTKSRYVGAGSSNGALAAVGVALEQHSPERAAQIGRIALHQARMEIRRKPELVIEDPNWKRHTNLTSRHFDGLEWLLRDPEFRQLWQDYRPAGHLGRFRLYRRIARPVPVSTRDSALK